MKIIMRGDDLGFSEGVNYGLEKAAREGVISSVGMMPNMPAARHGYKLIADCDIALGQHTNICVGKPLSNPALIPSLVQANGDFCSSREIRARSEDTIVVSEAEIEIEAQLQRFKEITGKEPDYFEGHAVFSKNFFIALANVAKRHGRFYINPSDHDWVERFGISALPWMDLDQNNLYDPQAYFTKHRDLIAANDCVLGIFHPGYLDQDILDHSSFTLIRPMECAFLCSEWLQEYLADNNFEVVDFRNYRQ